MPNCLNCPHAGQHTFCNLDEESRRFLENNSICAEYPRGTILFREGENLGAIYIVCSGRVKLSASAPQGKGMILRVAKAGDVLGMSSAMANVPSEVTSETMELTKVRIMQTRHLAQMLKTWAVASMRALEAVTADYKAAFEGARLFALTPSPSGKLARLILNWAEDSPKKGPASVVTMPYTHDELASMMGTTRETVTRTLGKLRKDNLIAIRGVSLTIQDELALQALVAN